MGQRRDLIIPTRHNLAMMNMTNVGGACTFQQALCPDCVKVI